MYFKEFFKPGSLKPMNQIFKFGILVENFAKI